MAGLAVASGLLVAALHRNSYYENDDSAKLKILISGLIIAAVFFMIFRLGRKIGVIVETTGGSQHAIAFKPSVIEGVTVDTDSALRVAAVLNNLAMRAANAAR